MARSERALPSWYGCSEQHARMLLPPIFWMASAAVFMMIAFLQVAVARSGLLGVGFVIVSVVHVRRGIYEYNK